MEQIQKVMRMKHDSLFILLYSRFLQHFALSSIGQEPILYDHLGVLFPSAELRNPASSQGDKVSTYTIYCEYIKFLVPLSSAAVTSVVLSLAETIQV